jgi:hypothetical protein
MKKIAFVTSLLLMAQVSFTNNGGSPQGKSGSPASNGQTCQSSYCHSGGSPSGNEQIIIHTSQEVYSDNDAITIDLGVLPQGASSKIGFCASVEDANGNILTGTTAATGAKKNGNYITHKSSSTAVSNDSIGWSFTLQESTYPDSLTVYVAVNFTNGNGNTSGDYVLTSSKTLRKSQMGLEEGKGFVLQVGPNPATDFLKASAQGLRSVSLYNTSGRFIDLDAFKTGNGEEIVMKVGDLARGTYLLTASFEDGTNQFKHVVLN